MKKFIENTVKILAAAAVLATMGLLFTGPFIESTPYYVTLSICFAVIIGTLVYSVKCGRSVENE